MEWLRRTSTFWNSHRQVDIQNEWTAFFPHHFQSTVKGIANPRFIRHVYTVYTIPLGDFQWIDGIEKHSCIFAGLLHGATCRCKGSGDDPIGLIIRDNPPAGSICAASCIRGMRNDHNGQPGIPDVTHLSKGLG